MALMNSIGLHWAFMKIRELGTKGYLKSQRRLDSYSQSIMGNERLITRAFSLMR